MHPSHLLERVGHTRSELESILLVAKGWIVDEVVLRTEREAKVLVNRKEQAGNDLRAQRRRLSCWRIECRKDRRRFVEDQPFREFLHIQLTDRSAYQIQLLPGWEV